MFSINFLLYKAKRFVLNKYKQEGILSFNIYILKGRFEIIFNFMVKFFKIKIGYTFLDIDK
jgi:hypothetical protein